MTILLIFAFISGLVTIFAPCIWPLLPIILSSSTSGGKRKPLGITLGIMVSFAIFTLSISYIVSVIPFDPNILRYFAVAIIGILGLSLVIPALNSLLEGYVSRLSSKFAIASNRGNGLWSGLITGLSLGIVWTPCAGPILATIATLAATQAVNFQIVLVTLVYVTGVGIPLFIFAVLGQRIFTKSKLVSRYTGRIQQIFGVIMIITALLIATNYDKLLQAKLLDAFPSYSQFIVDIESRAGVEEQLDLLRGNKPVDKKQMPFPDAQSVSLPVIGKAPEFVGINNWLNTEPLTLEKLRGKVVLVDFWTYTCINCIRTFPHIKSWYEDFKDQGFVVVGVHTPEFEFEKNTQNVQDALEMYGLTYPVAQDNDYATWKAYDNHYWPAHYLIDAQGHIRFTHFGEGKYDETRENIRKLLEEAGKEVEDQKSEIADETPRNPATPETYLGSLRVDRFASPEEFTSVSKIFTFPSSLPVHTFAYQGYWNITDEYSASVTGGELALHFFAKKVFLVIHPAEGSSSDLVRVYLDDVLISSTDAGADVVDGEAVVDMPKLYELLSLDEAQDRTLRLEFMSPGTMVFAFTFFGG